MHAISTQSRMQVISTNPTGTSSRPKRRTDSPSVAQWRAPCISPLYFAHPSQPPREGWEETPPGSHLRDSFTVAKVGIVCRRKPKCTPSRRNPECKSSRPTQQARHLDPSDGQTHRPSRSGEPPAFRLCISPILRSPTAKGGKRRLRVPIFATVSPSLRWASFADANQNARHLDAIQNASHLDQPNRHVISTQATDRLTVRRAVESPLHFAFVFRPSFAAPPRRVGRDASGFPSSRQFHRR